MRERARDRERERVLSRSVIRYVESNVDFVEKPKKKCEIFTSTTVL